MKRKLKMNSGETVFAATQLFFYLVGAALASSTNFTDAAAGDGNSGDKVKDVIVGLVIGVCGAAVIMFIMIFGVFQLFVRKDQVQDLDAVEYSIHEEYEARINFEALNKMDPEIRARIDFDLLGQLTNTSPDLLAPYKQLDTRSTTSGNGNGSGDGAAKPPSQLVRSASIQSINHISLKLTTMSECPEEDRSNYSHKRPTTPTHDKLRRANTISDINSSITLNEATAPVAPVKFVVRREGDENAKELKKDFLVAVAGSLLAGTSVISPRTLPSRNNSCRLPEISRKPEGRHWSLCTDRLSSDLPPPCRRECFSEGGTGDERQSSDRPCLLVGGDFDLGEECFAEIERRRASEQTQSSRGAKVQSQ